MLLWGWDIASAIPWVISPEVKKTEKNLTYWKNETKWNHILRLTKGRNGVEGKWDQEQGNKWNGEIVRNVVDTNPASAVGISKSIGVSTPN